MADTDEIFIHTLRALAPKDMSGLKVMLTLGPTREYFDQARFWSNPSTGLMGAALAVAAALRGAEVTAIHGPVSLTFPSFVRTVPVTSAREMFAAADEYFPSQDIGCFTAAVADFRPPQCELPKFKKSDKPLSLDFERNPDILSTLSKSKKTHQKTIGFAAEGESLRQNARRKLQEKNLDLLVANPIGEEGAGFAVSTNRVVVLDKTGREEHWPQMKKTEIAWRIWDWILASTD
jgi:phosphopantothenoylcysteine decarboxylase/phosphopantothenate--cysteine ligase